LEKDVIALIFWGRKRGLVGKVLDIRKVHPLKPKIVTLTLDGETVETIFRYVFPIGLDKPVISLRGI
jgi:ribosomal protein S4E